MNTLVLTVAVLSLGQLQPSQFNPNEVTSPVQPSPVGTDSIAEEQGGSYRLTDESPVPPPATIPAAEPPSQLIPDRNWTSPPRSNAAATRAQAETDVVPVYSTDSEALAAMILDGALDMRIHDGAEIALVDLLQRVADSRSRHQAVQSYWRLSIALAELNFSRHEARYLAELDRPQSQLEDSFLTAEATQARAREASAALKVLTYQEQLTDVGQLDTSDLPLPVDRPFVGPYRTHFNTLFADRPAPTSLKRIDRRLPHELEVIERRAEAVAAGERASSQLAEAYRNGSVGINQVLTALAQLSRNRRDLLASVLSYNEQIADYSFSVVGPGVSPESMLGTLIRQETAAQPTMLADANVRRASAESPVEDDTEVDASRPLRPTADPATGLSEEASAVAPNSRSILKRVTIDHP